MNDRIAGVILKTEMVVVSCTFFVFALLHLGVHFAGIEESRILAATIVETICGLCMAFAAVTAVADPTHAWRAAVTANAVSAGGVLLGIFAQSRGNGGTMLNFVYHRAVLVVMLASLILLLTQSGRNALRTSPPNTTMSGKSKRRSEHG